MNRFYLFNLIVLLLSFSLIGSAYADEPKGTPAPTATPTPVPTPTIPPYCEQGDVCEAMENYMLSPGADPDIVGSIGLVVCCDCIEIPCPFPWNLPDTVPNPQAGGPPLPIPTPGSDAVSAIMECVEAHEQAEADLERSGCGPNCEGGFGFGGYHEPNLTAAEQESLRKWSDCQGRTAQLNCLQGLDLSSVCGGDPTCILELQNYINYIEADQISKCNYAATHPTPTPPPTPTPTPTDPKE